jgi:hypothetical protein
MTHERAVCTIIAKNYISFARTLAQSFRSFHPDYKIYVLIVDEFERQVEPSQEHFEIVKLSDLGLPDQESLCFKYDVKELCTSVKADLLSYLLKQKSISQLIYLDPDILVTASLDELYAQLDTVDIILTPHLDQDFPADGLLPNDGYILRAGQFNLGFIAINSSENAKTFLNWWETKLSNNCVVDLVSGYFVDQKFIDFVPIFFQNFSIERGPGYNVAYWNLHSRKLNNENDSWTCNDGPLYFFHFSGYSPLGSSISSHIPASVARYSLSNRRDLRDLFTYYSERLLGNGYRESIEWSYSFDFFKTGEPITKEARRYYRELLTSGSAPRDPFNAAELKRQVVGSNRAPTEESQLDAILNSRAWSWVSRYGRMKQRITRILGPRS